MPVLEIGVKNGKPYVTNFLEKRYNPVTPTSYEAQAISCVNEILSLPDGNEGHYTLQRRSESYLTLVAPNDREFLRVKVSQRTKWFSIYVPPELRKDDDARLEPVPNKNQIYWKFTLSQIEDLKNYSDFITVAYNDAITV